MNKQMIIEKDREIGRVISEFTELNKELNNLRKEAEEMEKI